MLQGFKMSLHHAWLCFALRCSIVLLSDIVAPLRETKYFGAFEILETILVPCRQRASIRLTWRASSA